jgi:hypothetical protein
MGYWEHDAEFDYGRDKPYNIWDPHKLLKVESSGVYGGTDFTWDLSKKYKHQGNGCWYHPTSCGRWVPVAGQAIRISPRVLREDYLEGYKSPKVGDIVRLKTGTAPIRIEVTSGRYFTGQYVVSGKRVVARPIEEIVLHEDYNNMETQEDNTMTNIKTLYEIRISGASTLEQLHYGHYLATNSSGQWVMEEKGTGRIHTVDKADVVEVLPYTISLRFLNDNGMGKNYNYFADKDKYTAGQMFLMDNSFVIVVDVDTKSKLATKDFKPTVEILTKKVDS